MIEVNNLTFGYKAESFLKQSNFICTYGSIYRLLGKNGAGKSTLLNNFTGWYFQETGSKRICAEETVTFFFANHLFYS